MHQNLGFCRDLGDERKANNHSVSGSPLESNTELCSLLRHLTSLSGGGALRIPQKGRISRSRKELLVALRTNAV